MQTQSFLWHSCLRTAAFCPMHGKPTKQCSITVVIHWKLHRLERCTIHIVRELDSDNDDVPLACLPLLLLLPLSPVDPSSCLVLQGLLAGAPLPLVVCSHGCSSARCHCSKHQSMRQRLPCLVQGFCLWFLCHFDDSSLG